MPRERKRIFYGWWIVFSCAIISFYTSGAFYYGFTAFVDPIAKAFGWSYLAISVAASFRNVEIGIAAPVMGFLADRLGPRKLVFCAGLLGGLGFILLGRINSLATFYGAFILLSVGFSASSPTVVLTTAVANWFRRRITLAMGLTTAGAGIGGLLLPVTVWLVDNFGWQQSLTILGIASWIIIPPLALIIRHKPEQYGYVPDGLVEATKPAVAGDERRNVGPMATEVRARQALRTRTFWLLAAALAIQHLGFSAMVLHVMPHLTNIKLAVGTAALVATSVPVISVGSRLGFGWLGDIYSRKRLLACTMVLQGVGFVMLGYGQITWLLAPYAIMVGLGLGGTIALRPAILREYFGRNAFGSIQGMIIALMTLGGIAGPAIAGWVFDSRGSYQLAWISLGLVIAAGAPVVLAIRPAHLETAKDRLSQTPAQGTS